MFTAKPGTCSICQKSSEFFVKLTSGDKHLCEKCLLDCLEKSFPHTYTFTELLSAAEDPGSEVSESAVDETRDWFRSTMEDDWYSSVYEDWQELLQAVGFENAKIQFTGFWSQGDGASFVATVNVEKLIHFLSTEIPPAPDFDNKLACIVHKLKGKRTFNYKKLLLIRDHLECAVKRINNQYVHEHTCQFYCLFSTDHKRINKLVDDFASDAEDLRKDLCKAIYKDLKEEYEHQTSDEHYKDLSEANGYKFTGDGEIVKK